MSLPGRHKCLYPTLPSPHLRSGNPCHLLGCLSASLLGSSSEAGLRMSVVSVRLEVTGPSSLDLGLPLPQGEALVQEPASCCPICRQETPGMEVIWVPWSVHFSPATI